MKQEREEFWIEIDGKNYCPQSRVENLLAKWQERVFGLNNKNLTEIKEMFISDIDKLKNDECSVEDVFNSLAPFLSIQSPPPPLVKQQKE